MINVVKPFLPPQEEYNSIIKGIWDRAWLTNNGPLVQELEEKLQHYLDVPSMHFVTNGTMALQLAIKALNLTGEIITTPFSFVATTTAILWESCMPVYVDIRPDTLCIDADKIEEAITEKTSAILATHVYGIPCDVEKINLIAKKYNLKVIYDTAHAFGVKYKSKSLMRYGDISTLSFHATKVFHTIEGGGIVNNSSMDVNDKIKYLRSFGFDDEHYEIVGTNAKTSEFHAAMGIVNLNYIESNLVKRKHISEIYNSLLSKKIQVIHNKKDVEYNYAYYPVLLQNEKLLNKVVNLLAENSIHTRRYFYPSLNKLPYILGEYSCPISEDVSKRILCLPLYSDLEHDKVREIAALVNRVLLEGEK